MGIGTRVDIDFSQLDIDWLPGTAYTIQLGEGFVKEDGGEEQPSPANANFFSFTTNATGAAISSVSPVPTTILDNIDLVVFNYNRQITISTGQIKLYKVATPDVLVHTYNPTDAEINLGSNGTSIEISIDDYIKVGNIEYYFLFDADVVRDSDNFASPAVVNASLYRYTSPPPSLLVSYSPNVASSPTINPNFLTLTFNENIVRGTTGNIYLYKLGSPSQLINTYSYNSTALTFSGTTLSIRTQQYITNDSTYYILMDDGVARNNNGINYPGISSSVAVTWFTSSEMDYQASGNILSTTALTVEPREIVFADRFMTSTVPHVYVEDTIGNIGGYPEVTDYSRTTGFYTVDISTNPTDAIVKIDSTSTAPGLKDFNFSTKVLTVSGTRDNVNRYLANLVLYPTADYNQNFSITYTLKHGTTLNSGSAFFSRSQQMIVGTPTDSEITNMVGISRSFVANQKNKLFTTSLPFISDFDTSNPTYSVTFSSSSGQFTTDTYGSDLSSSWTFTGTRSEVNAKFDLIYFYPNKGVTSSSTFTYTQKKNNVTQLTTTETLSLSSTYTLPSTIVYDSAYLSTNPNRLVPGSWRPTLEEIIYYDDMDIFVKGGDGSNSVTSGGGGGGAGGSGTFTGIAIENTPYNIIIGLLGTNGSSGSPARVTKGTTAYVADGGTGGRYNLSAYWLGIVHPGNPDLDEYNLTYDFSAGATGGVYRVEPALTLSNPVPGQQVKGSVSVFEERTKPLTNYWFPKPTNAGPSSPTWFQVQPAGGTGTATGAGGRIVITLNL
jgi:hypothetical protein